MAIEIDNRKMWELILQNHPSEQDWINICDIKLALKDQGLCYKDGEITTIEPKFKVGDWVVCTKYGKQIQQIQKVYDDDSYLTNDYRLWTKENEQYMRLWTIEDAEDGDVLVSQKQTSIDGDWIGIYKRLETNGCMEVYCFCARDGRFTCNEYELKGRGTRPICPATQEQKQKLFDAMHKAGYMWDSENKQLLSLNAEPKERKVSGVLKKMLDNLDEESLAKTREEMQKTPEIAEFDKSIENLIGEIDGDYCVHISSYDDYINKFAPKILAAARKIIASELESEAQHLVESYHGNGSKFYSQSDYAEGIESVIKKIKGESV